MQNLPDQTENVNQLQLFETHLPERPYCADSFERGLRILPRRAAMRRRYIEPQPPWEHLWLLFDVDRDASWAAADEAGLPAPSITAINRQNGHGHLLYGLQVPLKMDTFGGRKAPVYYAETVERAMTAKLRADVTYSGLTCKNPLHRHWTVLQSGHLFTLRELHGWIADLRPYRRTRSEPRTGIGRNVETFDHVRIWATRGAAGSGPLVLEHKADGGSLETWRMACTGAAERFTAECHPSYHEGANHGPLQRSECRWIGSSVARWTWEKFTAAGLREWHAAGGREGKRGADPDSARSLRPWEREGVSRATWYRRRERAAGAVLVSRETI